MARRRTGALGREACKMAEENHSSENRRTNWAGVVLILVGCYLLASQFVSGRIMGMLAAPGIGVLCLLWGAASRSTGLIVIGGVVFGSGAGRCFGA